MRSLFPQNGRIVSGGILLALAVAAGAAALGEHGLRRAVQARLQQSIAQRDALAQQAAGVYVDLEQIKSELTLEGVRSRVFARQLAERTRTLESTMARLTEETHTVAGLQQRLAAMGQQLDQLQGELAMALQTPSAKPTAAGTVELERVIVSDGTAGLEGRIISVHPEWNFVVVDLGWDAVRIGDTLSIYRKDQLTAKARVERVQANVAAATILPEWQAAAVQVNDSARIL